MVRQPHDAVEITQHDAWALCHAIHIWPCWHVRCQPGELPRFEPFAGLRYSAAEPLDDVTAPPYDVLSIGDVETLLARHPHNIVAIDVPLDRDGPQRYDTAGRRLADWIREGVMV